MKKKKEQNPTKYTAGKLSEAAQAAADSFFKAKPKAESEKTPLQKRMQSGRA